MAEVDQKLKDLKELNKGQNIPALTDAQKDIRKQFEKASSLGENTLKNLMLLLGIFKLTTNNHILTKFL